MITNFVSHQTINLVITYFVNKQAINFVIINLIAKNLIITNFDCN